MLALTLFGVLGCDALGGPVEGFQTTAVSFVSADEGWVLGHEARCFDRSCEELFHTTDGGSSWRKVVGPPGETSRLMFADSRNGWAYYRGPLPGHDRDLYSTHDGGDTWNRVDMPDGVVSTAWSEPVVADGTVQIGLFTAHSGEVRILSSPVDADAFTVSERFRVDVPLSHRDSNDVEMGLTRAGSTTWLDIIVSTPRNTRSPGVGARFVDGRWSAWTLPCVDPHRPRLAALSPTDLVATCAVDGEVDPRSGEFHLFVSADGGATFTDRGALAPKDTRVHLVGAASTQDLVVVTPTGDVDAPTALRTSHDGGRTWTTTLNPRTKLAGTPTGAWGRFVTPTMGFAVLSFVSTEHGIDDPLYLTHDGGDTWKRFAPR